MVNANHDFFQSTSFLQLKDENGWEAIHYAARAGNKKVIELLLNYNVNINNLADDGRSALAIARVFLTEDHEVINYLLENGALDHEEL